MTSQQQSRRSAKSTAGPSGRHTHVESRAERQKQASSEAGLQINRNDSRRRERQGEEDEHQLPMKRSRGEDGHGRQGGGTQHNGGGAGSEALRQRAFPSDAHRISAVIQVRGHPCNVALLEFSISLVVMVICLHQEHAQGESCLTLDFKVGYAFEEMAAFLLCLVALH
jgi:hypothetical protein